MIELTGNLKKQKDVSIKSGSIVGTYVPFPTANQQQDYFLTINGFPAGTIFASAWVTEGPDVSEAGSAIVYTQSVQFNNNGTSLRVKANVQSCDTRGLAVQIIYIQP